jgi:hypothetical protein
MAISFPLRSASFANQRLAERRAKKIAARGLLLALAGRPLGPAESPKTAQQIELSDSMPGRAPAFVTIVCSFYVLVKRGQRLSLNFGFRPMNKLVVVLPIDRPPPCRSKTDPGAPSAILKSP